MANGVGAFDVQSGFNVGRQIAGPNALGILAKSLLDRVNQMGDIQMGIAGQQRLQTALLPGEVEKAKALMQLDPTKRFLDYLVGQSEPTVGGISQTTPSVSPTMSSSPLKTHLAALQSQLGPGQELSIGPLKVQSTQLTPFQQSESDLRQQEVRKTKQEVERRKRPFLSSIFGTPIPDESPNNTKGLRITGIERE